MRKRNILGLFVGLIIGLYTVLGMSLFTFFNLKYHSVYYAQHIPHKEGTDLRTSVIFQKKQKELKLMNQKLNERSGKIFPQL